MTVETLSSGRVLISLKREDMENFELDFETLRAGEEKTERALKRIIFIACAGSGIRLSGKSLLVEALPAVSGCLLVVSLNRAKKRRVYRVKKTREYPCFAFSSADEMLDAVNGLARLQPYFYPNSLLRTEGGYLLVFDYPAVSVRVKAFLSEFGRAVTLSPIRLARLRETAETLVSGNAVTRITERP